MKKRKAVMIVSVAFLLYIASYAVASSLGQYEPTQSGEARYQFGLSVTDIEIWKPAGIEFKRMKEVEGSYRTSANLFGYVYYPLILLDRTAVHKTHELSTKTTETQIKTQ